MNFILQSTLFDVPAEELMFSFLSENIDISSLDKVKQKLLHRFGSSIKKRKIISTVKMVIYRYALQVSVNYTINRSQ
jgi:hypothetical protein